MKVQNKDQWWNAFMRACVHGNIGEVKMLCEKKYLDLGWADIHANKEAGVQEAVRNGHIKIVKYLLTSPELLEAGHAFANVHEREDMIFFDALRKDKNILRWLIMDYGIKKTQEIEVILLEFEHLENASTAKEWFRARDEFTSIKATLVHQNQEDDERAIKKAKKL